MNFPNPRNFYVIVRKGKKSVINFGKFLNFFLENTMLKATAGRMLTLFKSSVGLARPMTVGAVRHSSHSTETDEQFDARYEAYFNR